MAKPTGPKGKFDIRAIDFAQSTRRFTEAMGRAMEVHAQTPDAQYRDAVAQSTARFYGRVSHPLFSDPTALAPQLVPVLAAMRPHPFGEADAVLQRHGVDPRTLSARYIYDEAQVRLELQDLRREPMAWQEVVAYARLCLEPLGVFDARHWALDRLDTAYRSGVNALQLGALDVCISLASICDAAELLAADCYVKRGGNVSTGRWRARRELVMCTYQDSMRRQFDPKHVERMMDDYRTAMLQRRYAVAKDIAVAQQCVGDERQLLECGAAGSWHQALAVCARVVEAQKFHGPAAALGELILHASYLHENPKREFGRKLIDDYVGVMLEQGHVMGAALRPLQYVFRDQETQRASHRLGYLGMKLLRQVEYAEHLQGRDDLAASAAVLQTFRVLGQGVVTPVKQLWSLGQILDQSVRWSPGMSEYESFGFVASVKDLVLSPAERTTFTTRYYTPIYRFLETLDAQQPDFQYLRKLSAWCDGVMVRRDESAFEIHVAAGAQRLVTTFLNVHS